MGMAPWGQNRQCSCMAACERLGCWQAPCAASGDWYGGQLVVKGDAYKTDGSWLRIQILQVPGPGSAAAVAMRTSGTQAGLFPFSGGRLSVYGKA